MPDPNEDPKQTPGREPIRKKKVLIVDDEEKDRAYMVPILTEYCDVIEVPTGRLALERLKKEQIDVVLLDITMPGMDGFRVLSEIKACDPTVEVIMVSRDTSSRSGFTAAQLGAFGYVNKPSVLEDSLALLGPLKQALEKRALVRKNMALRMEHPAGNLIGESKAIRELERLIHIAAKETESDILILGETGVGKSTVARAIHEASPRQPSPFLTVDCSAVPSNLLESELFGYEKGAFTGAVDRKLGKFEFANGGTVFLDEIGDMALEAQMKLLRVLQERVVERLGGLEHMPIDVRVISATNQDLKAAMLRQTFRKDLYYRLEKYVIPIPPLRDRQEDIPLLLDYFVTQCNHQYRKHKVMTPGFVEACVAYAWPGNVREMMNLLDRIVCVHQGEEMTEADLPEEFFRPGDALAVFGEHPDDDVVHVEGRVARGGPQEKGSSATHTGSYRDRIQASERDILLAALDEAEGNQSEAARILHMNRKTFHHRLRALGLPPKDSDG